MARRERMAASGNPCADTLNSMADGWKPALRKVCGIRRAVDARHAARSGANAIGMIFYPPSPRAIAPAEADRVAAAVPDGVRRVGVFVNERPAAIAATVRQAGLHTVQLHGDENPAECDAVRNAVGRAVEIWKAVRVGTGFDGTALATFDVDAFLLDTARDGSYGGTGEAFPWHLAAFAKPFGKIILSGGLDGSNAADAARIVRPWGVDSSSRLEARPGVKDPERVERFLRAVL